MDTGAVRHISDSATRKALAADSRVALLDALAQAGRPLDAVEASELVGLHRNTARVHLEQLTEAGLVQRHRESRSRPGRPKVFYTAIAASDGEFRSTGAPAGREDVAGYRELARVLALQIEGSADPAAEAERAGWRWASAVGRAALPHPPATAAAAVEAVRGVMEDLGFRPVADEERILLRRCPFADVAGEHRVVVCGVHLGMLRQTFDALDAPVTVERLDPLVQTDPLLCVAHLGQRPIGTRHTPQTDPNGH